ncbi:MAG: 30S ribosomal protein S20 [Bacteroidales bacterium]|nr:30S ribosomal protein S20 [Bacteroidales bacterium]MCB8999931.1 30S ribosomal protein S20 [Bacteroidales bacterium]MCB9012618.1 30S ribosomal protein S20 [Bacteroidales bacterium]
MAHHKSAKKRIRQTESKRLSNKYNARGMRNALKELRGTGEKAAAEELLPKVNSMLDKLAKTNVIHKNKASNLKSKIQKHVSGLS